MNNANTAAIMVANVQAWRLEQRLQAQTRRQVIVKHAMGSALRDALKTAIPVVKNVFQFEGRK